MPEVARSDPLPEVGVLEVVGLDREPDDVVRLLRAGKHTIDVERILPAVALEDTSALSVVGPAAHDPAAEGRHRLGERVVGP